MVGFERVVGDDDEKRERNMEEHVFLGFGVVSGLICRIQQILFQL